jgi:Uma2 family endonuclease
VTATETKRWTSTAAKGWTIADLEDIPQPWDDTRYEIIDGELYVSSQPSNGHQYTSTEVGSLLRNWSKGGGGGVVLVAPGLIFADDDNAAPDVIWASNERYRREIGGDDKLHGPPELVVEVLSPGSVNERRDFVAKLGLYTRRGVDEYWILDWRQRRALIHRRVGGALERVATLEAQDRLESPLLPGFSCVVDDLFPPQNWPAR